jgi:hypothetical protein
MQVLEGTAPQHRREPDTTPSAYHCPGKGQSRRHRTTRPTKRRGPQRRPVFLSAVTIGQIASMPHLMVLESRTFRVRPTERFENASTS